MPEEKGLIFMFTRKLREQAAAKLVEVLTKLNIHEETAAQTAKAIVDSIMQVLVSFAPEGLKGSPTELLKNASFHLGLVSCVSGALQVYAHIAADQATSAASVVVDLIISQVAP